MTIGKDSFLGIFNILTDKWAPLLGLRLSADDNPRSETQPVNINATFDIDVNYTHQTLGGRRNTNLSYIEEVTHASKQLINECLTGKNKHICGILHHELSSKSIFAHNLNKIPLETYSNSCLISCDKCSGGGKIACSSCFGKGKNQLIKDILVGHEEYWSGNRLVKREPKYRTVPYFVDCIICRGSGKIKCDTCNGGGSNTYLETVEFFAKNTNLTNHWTAFSETKWVNDYLKGRPDISTYRYSAKWNIAKIVVTNNGNGSFNANMPGTITGSDCNCKMTSDYGVSQGSLKILGGFIYDCDYIYSPHIIKAVNRAINKEDLSANSVSPITSSKMFNYCAEPNNGDELERVDELFSQNMINESARERLYSLFNVLKNAITNERENLPLGSIFWRSVIMFFALCIPLAMGAHYFGNGVYEQFNLVKIIGQLFILVVKLFQFNEDAFGLLMLLFFPSLLLMSIFGASRKWTAKRMFRWFAICAPLLAAILSLYDKAPTTPALPISKSLILGLPMLHIAVFALLGGILLARKKVWRLQNKLMNPYHSDALNKFSKK